MGIPTQDDPTHLAMTGASAYATPHARTLASRAKDRARRHKATDAPKRIVFSDPPEGTIDSTHNQAS
jgi:hypothetical protein